ncbi:MAG TPA: tetratricopeptide repeat protein [Xanthobacteraceae bacterium]|jgi:tetratricopeptide (TPR) repeat protein
MSTRFGATLRSAIFAAAFVLPVALPALLPAPAWAQTNRRFLEPPSNLPRLQQGLNLDRLFEALKIAPDDESAKYVENRIWAMWIATDSDTTTLLMTRVKAAVDAKDLDLGIKLLTAVIEIKPDYIEAWNRRATLYYTKKDFDRSLADIHEVLKREPRHFGALSGLGMIMQELGDDKHALEAFRRALTVHPHLEHIPDLVKQLSEKVEGRDI